MKTFPLILVMFFLSQSVFGQNAANLKKKIDSLIIQKEKYTEYLQQINIELDQLNRQYINQLEAESRDTNATDAQSVKKNRFVTIERTALVESPNLIAKEILTLPEGEVLVSLERVSNYIKVIHSGKVGYVNYFYVDDYDIYQQNKQERLELERQQNIVQEKAAADKKVADAKAAADQEKRENEKRNKLMVKYNNSEYVSTIMNKKVKIGMTSGMVIDSWGKPKSINKTVGSWGVHEQWVYSSAFLYFENGVMTSYQTQR